MSTVVRLESAAADIPRVVMGEVQEDVWTTIAAEIDGEMDHESIGQRQRRRRVKLAFKEQGEHWLGEQEEKGWTRVHGPTPCAATYFGPTDSPSNCWSCEVAKEVDAS